MIRSDLLPGVLAQREALLGAIDTVLASGWYVLGREVQRFEAAFAAHIGLPHAVGVASGTDALVLALLACDVAPGDEVVLPAHTALASGMAVLLRGAVPVFADIDPLTHTLSVEATEAAVSPRTRAILPVHLYGAPCDIAALAALAKSRGLALIEDCAQAHGAQVDGRSVGSFGDASAWSFYPTKNLGALGDAGLVATADGALAERLRALRNYGQHEAGCAETLGHNSRLDELQAAVLSVRLPGLTEANARRRAIAARYRERLASCAGLSLPAHDVYGRHVYHQFVVRHARRDLLRAWLEARGIRTLIHYPLPLHRQPAFVQARCAGDLTQTERAAAEVLSLPLYPEMTDADVDAVCEAIAAFTATER